MRGRLQQEILDALRQERALLLPRHNRGKVRLEQLVREFHCWDYGLPEGYIDLTTGTASNGAAGSGDGYVLNTGGTSGQSAGFTQTTANWRGDRSPRTRVWFVTPDDLADCNINAGFEDTAGTRHARFEYREGVGATWRFSTQETASPEQTPAVAAATAGQLVLVEVANVGGVWQASILTGAPVNGSSRGIALVAQHSTTIPTPAGPMNLYLEINNTDNVERELRVVAHEIEQEMPSA